MEARKEKSVSIFNRKGLLFIAIILVAGMAWTLPAGVNAAPYYKGKTISMIVGLGAGSGGTQVARSIARHLGKHIPGNPKVIVKNMPGAGTLKAQNFIVEKGGKEGLKIYYGPWLGIGAAIGRTKGMRFGSYSKVTSLGGVRVAGLVLYTGTEEMYTGKDEETGAEIKSAKLPGNIKDASDLVGMTMRFGASTLRSGRAIVSVLTLEMMGFKTILVTGYEGGGKMRAAVYSGEVEAGVEAAHEYINQVVPNLIDKGKGIPLWSIPIIDKSGHLAKDPLVGQVPYFPDVYRKIHGKDPSGRSWEAVVTTLKLDQAMQHALFGPPDMNPEAAAALRKGLMATMSSQAYIDDATKIFTYSPTPIPYKRAIEIHAAPLKVDQNYSKFMNDFLDKYNPKK
jgi:hypothetical protein